MDIVGGDQRNIQFTGKSDQLIVERFLTVQFRVILQLQIKIILAEQFIVFQNPLLGFVELAVFNQAGNFAAQAGGAGDQTFVMLLQ